MDFPALIGMLGAMMALEVIREILVFDEGLVGTLLLVDALDMGSSQSAQRTSCGRMRVIECVNLRNCSTLGGPKSSN
jgi:hypothetical protein